MDEEPSPTDLLWAHQLSRQLYQIHERTNSLESDQQQTRAALEEIQGSIDSNDRCDVKDAVQNLSRLCQTHNDALDQKVDTLSDYVTRIHEQVETIQSQNNAIRLQNDSLMEENESLRSLATEILDTLRERQPRLPRSRTVSRDPAPTPIIPTSPTESQFLISPPSRNIDSLPHHRAGERMVGDWTAVDRTTPLPPQKTLGRGNGRKLSSHSDHKRQRAAKNAPVPLARPPTKRLRNLGKLSSLVNRPPIASFNIVGEPHAVPVQQRHVYSERSGAGQLLQRDDGEKPPNRFTIIGEPHSGPRERRRQHFPSK